MKRRNRTHCVLTLAALGAVGGMIFPSGEHEQVFADSGTMVSVVRMDSALTQNWIGKELIGTGGAPREETAAVEERSRDSSRVVDPPTERCIRKYGPAIKRYSLQYGVDWRLVLAIMRQESRYSHTAESHKGATGLMQLMPVTRDELARELDLKDLSHPDHNIQAGIFYLRKLYDLFDGSDEGDRLKLTLAAYNAGFSRVQDAQALALHMLDKPTQWAAVRSALPLLSRQFYTLHRSTWGQDRPKSGWFGNSRETIGYVDSVMDHYGSFILSLN